MRAFSELQSRTHLIAEITRCYRIFWLQLDDLLKGFGPWLR